MAGGRDGRRAELAQWRNGRGEPKALRRAGRAARPAPRGRARRGGRQCAPPGRIRHGRLELPDTAARGRLPGRCAGRRRRPGRRPRTRRTGHRPRRRHVLRGQLHRPGDRPRFLPPHERHPRRRPRLPHRPRPAGRGHVRPAEGRGPLRAALRARPLHAEPGDLRRHDRQQRLRPPRRGLRADRGQRRPAAPAPGRRARGRGRPRRPGRGRRRRPGRTRRSQPRGHPHRPRPLQAPGLRLLAGAPPARERAEPRLLPRRQRGNPGPGHRGHGPARAPPGLAGARRPRISGHGLRRRRHRAPPGPRPAGRRRPGRPTRRRGQAGQGLRALIARRSRVALRRSRGRGGRRRHDAGASPGRRSGHRRRGHPARRARGSGTVAHPRRRRGSGRPHPGGQPRLAGMGGFGRPAGEPRRLYPRVRGPPRIARPGRPPLRALRRRLPAHPHRLPPRRGRRAAEIPGLHGGGGGPRRPLRRFALRRARRRPGPLGTARAHVRLGDPQPVRPGQKPVRPCRSPQSGSPRAPRPARRAHAPPGRPPDRVRGRLPLRRRPRRHDPGRPPLHGRGQLPRQPLRHRDVHVPLLRGHARREGRDPGAGPRPAGGGQRRPARLDGAGGPGVPRPVPGV